MDTHGIMIAFLILLLGAAIGYVSGVLTMRSNYVPLIRWYQHQNQKLQRRMREIMN